MAARLAALALLLPAIALAQQPEMRVNVVIVESIEDFARWLQQRPTPQGSYPASLKEIPAGMKVHFPIVVYGLRAPEQGTMTLVADLEFVGPDGKQVGAVPKCCTYTVTNRPDIRTAMLGPTMNLQLESGGPKGAYTVRVSVTDGARTATASETFQFALPKSAAPPPAPAAAPARAPAAAPKLQMGVPPAKSPGRDGDKRDCLTLPTPAEVIKCTERR